MFVFIIIVHAQITGEQNMYYNTYL